MNYFLYSVTLAPGIACPRRGGVSGPQQWLLMAPVIGDILHQSDLHPTQANSPLAEYNPCSTGRILSESVQV